MLPTVGIEDDELHLLIGTVLRHLGPSFVAH